MRILALDTSSVVSVACVEASDDGLTIINQRSTADTHRHAEDLVPACQHLLAQTGWQRPDAVLVGEGPGPFTGLRVGIAAAETLAFAWGVDVWGICSLDGLAAELLDTLPPAKGEENAQGGPASSAERPVITAALDARRRELYWATYSATGARLTGPYVSTPDHLPADLPVGGAGAAARAEDLAATAATVVPGTQDTVVSAAYLAQAWHAAGRPAANPEARYLRESDAVVPAAMKARN